MEHAWQRQGCHERDHAVCWEGKKKAGGTPGRSMEVAAGT